MAGNVNQLRQVIDGEVIRPGDRTYDDARKVWNGAIDRSPKGVVRCAGVSDVVAAVRFARERDLLVSVRGGGHGVGGHAVCECGLVIDLSPMKPIEVEPSRHTARAEAGVSGASSTGRRRRSGSQRRVASSRTRASPGSRSAAGSA